jgi:hypothetical protein
MNQENIEKERLAHSDERSGFDQGVRGDDQAGIKETPSGAAPTYEEGRQGKTWAGSHKGDTETQVIGEPLKT